MAVPVMPQILLYSLKKFCSVIVASVCVSSLILHAFLGLDRLVQAVAPVPAGHQAAGELVDDDDLAVLDDVVHVALVEVVGLERVVDQVRPFHVAGRVEALDAGQLFRLAHAFVGQVGGVLFFLDLEVTSPSCSCRAMWSASAYLADVVVRRAGDDQRRAGFVDQDVVDFVDDRVVQRPLRLLLVLADSDRRRGRRAACCRADSRSRIRCSCRR